MSAARTATKNMQTWVALLRGVNVGKAKRVPMETLRHLLAGLGATEVQTLLNSGNAVFSAPGPASVARAAQWAAALSAAIRGELGFDVPVVVKTARQWSSLMQAMPLQDVPDASRLLVAVTADTAALQALKPLAETVAAPEAFAVGAHAAYLHCPQGILQSTAASALLGKAGQAVTTRNWATALKILAAVHAQDKR